MIDLIIKYYINFIIILGCLGILGLALNYAGYWFNTKDVWLQLFQLCGWGFSVIFSITEIINWLPKRNSNKLYYSNAMQNKYKRVEA